MTRRSALSGVGGRTRRVLRCRSRAGAAYALTDNLTVPVLAHGIYNALVATVVYVSLSAWAPGRRRTTSAPRT